jgi:hypothetical protein
VEDERRRPVQRARGHDGASGGERLEAIVTGPRLAAGETRALAVFADRPAGGGRSEEASASSSATAEGGRDRAEYSALKAEIPRNGALSSASMPSPIFSGQRI